MSERCRGPAEKVIVYRSRIKIDDNCGAEGDRTLDLVNAIHALSQLSYSPGIFRRSVRRMQVELRAQLREIYEECPKESTLDADSLHFYRLFLILGQAQISSYFAGEFEKIGSPFLPVPYPAPHDEQETSKKGA